MQADLVLQLSIISTQIILQGQDVKQIFLKKYFIFWFNSFNKIDITPIQRAIHYLAVAQVLIFTFSHTFLEDVGSLQLFSFQKSRKKVVLPLYLPQSNHESRGLYLFACFLENNNTSKRCQSWHKSVTVISICTKD